MEDVLMALLGVIQDVGLAQTNANLDIMQSIDVLVIGFRKELVEIMIQILVMSGPLGQTLKIAIATMVV
jgi:hypothetical protein